MSGPFDPAVAETPELLVCRAAVAAGVVDGCGAELLVRDDVRFPLGGTDDVVATLLEVEFSFWEGVSPLVVRTGAAEAVPDVAAALDRWPVGAGRVAALPVAAVVAVPLRTHHGRVGVLVGYRAETLRTGDPLVTELEHVAGALAVVVSRRLDAASALDELDRTQDPDDGALPVPTLPRAVGVVMGTLGVHDSEAVALLRAHAASHDVLLDDVAERVLGGRLAPSDLAS